MPVNHLLDDHARLLAFHFHGAVHSKDVESAVQQLAEASNPEIEYRSFLVFHGSTDLSGIGPEELKVIKARMNQAYDAAAVQRPVGAIVVDGSLDAKMIMPLWKAMCEADPETGVRYRFFIEVAPALAWLDVVETEELSTLLDQPGKSPKQNG